MTQKHDEVVQKLRDRLKRQEATNDDDYTVSFHFLGSISPQFASMLSHKSFKCC